MLAANAADWDVVLRTNLSCIMRCTRLLAPALARTHGTLLILGSIAGCVTRPKNAVYASSKWGVRGWVVAIREV